jgi:SAM-dependent methyltransferase
VIDDPDDEAYDLDAGTTEHYVDAPLYDFEYRRRRADVNFYRRLGAEAGRPGPILELGCGTGRLTLALARDGFDVVGIDLAQAMLLRAAERTARLGQTARRRVRLVRADMRAFALGRKFPLVVSPFHAMQHLYTRSDFAACLARVKEHLAPGGRFAFDVLAPDIAWLTKDSRKRWARTKFRHPVTREPMVYSTNHTYDPVSQIAYIRLYYESGEGETKRTQVVRLCHRQFFPAELEALVAASGFRVVERWGGFAGQELEGDSESQVLVCAVG